MNKYDPTDFLGRPIRVGDLVCIGSNSGLRLGRVEAIFEYENRCHDEYFHTIKVLKTDGRRQGFNTNIMGNEKFWKVELNSLGNPVI